MLSDSELNDPHTATVTMADSNSDAAKESGAGAAAAAHVDVRPAGDDDDETNGSVGLVRLFRFATPFDSFVLLIGTISAIAGGAVNAAFAILLGRVMGREWPSRRLRFPA